MRNLKKVLSLSLALVMLLGMMVVGAGAAGTKFADDSKITEDYKEAVAVMNAIKVIEGKGENNFDPAGTLKRGEAAKILVAMTMGNKAADAMKSQTKSAVFTDMADHWAAGLVDACYSLGIVKGRDNNTYDPEGTLTGTEFAAMLLRAAGVEGEFTGSAWEANVRVAATKAGLTNVTSASLPREQAAQMAFEGLTYSPSGEKTYSYNGQTYDSFFEAYLVADAKGEADKIKVDTASDSLAKTVFGLTKGTTTDAFGRTLETWNVTGEKDPVYTSTTPVGSSASYNTKQSLKADAFKFADEVTFSVDGAETKVAKASALNTLNDATGNGVQVDVYKDKDGNVNKVVVVNTQLMQISRIATKQVSLTKVAGAGNIVGSIAAVADTNDCFDTLSGMEKGDYVLVTAARPEAGGAYVVQSAVAPTVITGNATRVVTTAGKESVTVDGTEYPVAKVSTGVKTMPVSSKDTATLYLDTFGNAIYGTSEATAPVGQVNAIYVTSTWQETVRGNPVDMFEGVAADGTVVTGSYTANAALSAATGANVIEYNGSSNGKASPKLVIVTKTSPKYEFAAVAIAPSGDDAGTGAGAFQSSQNIAASDIRLNTTNAGSGRTELYADNVKFVYVDQTATSVKATVREGVQKTAVTNTDYFVIEDDGYDKVVTTVFLYKTAPVVSTDFIYVAKALENSKIKQDQNDTTLYGYEVYLNGEKQTLYFAHKNDNTVENGAVGLHQYTQDEKTGAYVLGTTESLSVELAVGAARQNKSGKYFVAGTVGGTDIGDYNATDALVIDTRKDGDVDSMGALVEASKDSKLNVWVVYDGDEKTVKTIYVADVVKQIEGGNVTSIEEKATINADTTVTEITGSAEVSVSTGQTLTIANNGKIAAGADITIDDLDGLAVSGKITANEAVKLNPSVTSGDLMAKLPANVPVLINQKNTTTSFTGMTDNEAWTIFVKYNREATGAPGASYKAITLTITDADTGAEVYTQTTTTELSSTTGSWRISMVDPDSNQATNDALANSTHYVLTVTQKGNDTPLTTVEFTTPASYT